ncbi:MAG TPA: ABC transporter substrate-binding protein [Stellaceae bacterium]|nr:ABC transporter substrate-binding protein [Stellaceae bacterium]
MKRFGLGVAAAIAAAFVVMTGSAPVMGAGAPYVIRVGWVVTPGHLAPLIEELGRRKPQLFKHLGKSYIMEAVHFRGTTPEIEAQAIGDLQVASFSSAAVALAITNAHLDERVVADVVSDGMHGYFSEDFVVRADGPIKTIADLKGKRVATNAIGSASDEAMRTMLHKHGLKDSDFTTVEAGFANMPAMLEEGKVDMIGVLPQFAHGIIGNPQYKVLFTAKDAVGPSQAVVWAIRAGVIKAHRAAFVDFFEDHIRARRWLLDPKNRKEALAITSYVTKQPESQLAFAFTKKDFYRSPDARPDLASMQREIDDSVKLGVLPKPVTLSPTYVDLSLIEEAKKRIDMGE